MSWHRSLSDYQRKKEREEREEECSERYKQFSRDDLQVKREEVEATLESLTRDFPDWENQTQSRAYSEIRRLERERECIILELTKRSEAHASRIVDEGAKQEGMARESTNALTPEQKRQDEGGVGRGKFCDQVIQEIKRIKNLSVTTGRSVAEIEDEFPEFVVWKVRTSLSSEDREAFNHPRQWGPPVGYAKMVLSKICDVTVHTLTSWVKAYRKSLKTKGA